jgi:hypothetical protein
MPRLKSANFAVTELASDITNAATSFQVVDASLFPNEGPFIVLVHDSTPGFAGVREIMEVGSINKGTNTFSDVLRGREGTSPVAHSAGARAECVWTAGTHGELADKVDLDAHLADNAKHVTKDGVLQTGLNADQVDGYHAGNSSGQIPISNGTVCTNLNADKVDSEDAATLKINARTYNSKLVVEVSSSAPSSPTNGQIWYDSTNNKFKGCANGAWV